MVLLYYYFCTITFVLLLLYYYFGTITLVLTQILFT
jgi:hypothetical protein